MAAIMQNDELEPEINGNGWDESELKEITQKVLSVVGDKSFKSEIVKVNWTEIATEDRDANECKAMFLKLTHQIRKHRTVPEILEEVAENLPQAIQNLNSKTISRPISSFLMYYGNRRAKMKKKHPNLSKEDLRSKIRAHWDSSNEIQAKYKEIYFQAYERYKMLRSSQKDENGTHINKKAPKQKKPKFPTPYHVFLDKNKISELGENPEMDSKEQSRFLKVKYAKLSDKKKFRIMCKSLQKLQEYKEDSERYLEKHPDFVSTSFDMYHYLSKEEKRILNEKIPKPQACALNSYLYFCSKERPLLKSAGIVDQTKELSLKYSCIDQSEKIDNETEFKESVECHIKDLLEYSDNISPWCNGASKSADLQIQKYQRILKNSQAKERKVIIKTEKDTASLPRTPTKSQKRKKAAEEERTPFEKSSKKSKKANTTGALIASILSDELPEGKDVGSKSAITSDTNDNGSDSSNDSFDKELNVQIFTPHRNSPFKASKNES